MKSFATSLKSCILAFAFVVSSWALPAQIHKDSHEISSWAQNCLITRGFLNIADTSAVDNGSNRASVGSAEDATGEADGRVVSLGDGGSATYILEAPLQNGEGPDFAIFENGFQEQVPPQLWFLELAVVEVSSDGEKYFRFPASSQTQTNTQVGTFGQLDPTLLHNLAGKYPVFYGTPFDLSDLQDVEGLNLQAITHIRIIDVVGSIDQEYGTPDSQGNLINDPFPTPFRSGGFDLDALAILGQAASRHQLAASDSQLRIFPNPVTSGEEFTIATPLLDGKAIISVIDLGGGKILFSEELNSTGSESLKSRIENTGIFLIRIQTPSAIRYQKLFVR